MNHGCFVLLFCSFFFFYFFFISFILLSVSQRISYTLSSICFSVAGCWSSIPCCLPSVFLLLVAGPQYLAVFHLFFCCWLLVLNTWLTSSAFRFLPDNSISFTKLVCFKFLLSKESHVANAILIIKVLHGLKSGTNSSTISGMIQCCSTSPETMRLIRDGEPIVVKART